MKAVQTNTEVSRGVIVAFFPGCSAGIQGQSDVLRGCVGVGVEIEAEAGVLRGGRTGTCENEGAQNSYLQGEIEAFRHDEILLPTDWWRYADAQAKVPQGVPHLSVLGRCFTK